MAAKEPGTRGMGTPSVKYLATADDDCAFGANALLWAVVVGTAAASTVVTVYNGTDTSGEVKAVITGATFGTHHFYGARFPAGLYVKMTAGSAKVSVVAE